MEFYNDQLQSECQALSGGVPVEAGKRPIYKSKGQPDINFLRELYQGFWEYNKDRLDSQYQLSRGRCHVRAHLICELLHNYGIDTLKVYKHWRTDDWWVFGPDRCWRFHAAAMIIDSDNNKWVWDPWIGKNSHLLTLKEWLFDKESPRPTKLLVANRTVIGDWEKAKASYTFARDLIPMDDYLVTFQALLFSVIPIRPAPLLTETAGLHLLFAIKRKNEITNGNEPSKRLIRQT